MTLSTIRDLRLDEADIAANFFHQQWRENHIFYREPRALRWLYHESPYARDYSEGFTIKAAFDDHTLTGVFAYVPFLMNTRGTASPGINLSAWWVSPDHRRGSLGSRLLHSLQHHPGVHTCIAGINTAIAETYYDRLGWHILRCIPRWVLPIDPASFLEILAPNQRDHSPPVKPVREGRKVTGSTSTSAVGSLSEIDPERWDRFFWGDLSPTYVGPARTAAYLKWRYDEIPIFKYHAAVSHTGGALDGLIVYRSEPVMAEPLEVVRIVDIVALPRSIPALLEHVIEDSRRSNVTLIDCFTTSPEHRRALEQSGFLDARAPDGNRYWVPHLFQPRDHARDRLNASWWSRDDAPKARHDPQSLLLMKGDYEFDRPN